MQPSTSGLSLSTEHRSEATAVLQQALNIGVDFKLQPEIYRSRMAPEQARDLLLSALPEEPTDASAVVSEFEQTLLPLCKNEASPRFLGFGDTGDDVAALAGGILSLFTQQNLINQRFDSPSATFVEIAVLRWLRNLLGFTNPDSDDVSTVWDVGGLITPGGTMSNTVAMMLAREHHVPGTMHHGVTDPEQFGIIVPRGIGHYSVKSALTWIGLGSQLIEVDTAGYRYDMGALTQALRDNAGRVMSVVAYAGDSRTQTIEDLRAVHDVVRSADDRIWLHADACWGLLCAFSDKLRYKIDGIADFDSVTVDPHKVMAVPYSLSALLARVPSSLRAVSTYSDLIMQEDFAFGQVTPFIGTKGWMSLKLWMLMRTHGRSGLAASAEARTAKAQVFAKHIADHPRLVLLQDPDLLAVTFMYLPGCVRLADVSDADLALLNDANQWIHERIITEGEWHLHQFSAPDDGSVVRDGATLYPLRFMAANSQIQDEHMTGVVDYVLSLGRQWEQAHNERDRS